MGYYPDPSPRKVNGCLETLILTKVAFQVLAPALGLLFGSLLGIVLLVYAFSTRWWLGVIGLGLAGFALYLLSRWDKKRIREFEKAEGLDRDTPPRHRMR